jgi:hypothetical protein
MVPPDEDPSLSASSGNDPDATGEAHSATEASGATEEAYGPIGFRRYAKDDGRALILYTRGGPAQDGAVQDGPAHT